jgi:translocation and assembly module TamA
LNTYGTSYTYYQQSKWLHTYAIEVANEDSVVADVEVNSHLLIPSVTFARTKTDGSPYVLGGWSLLAKLSGSPKTLGSDLSFEQFSFRAKYVEGLTYGRLLLRTEVGVTDVNDFGRLPASLRFFAGGATSVRGYDYESLGPKENDKVVGGNNLWVNTLEYDYKFLPSWAVAVFVDAGNAADDFNLELKRGAGMGLRWISPVGPVRLDVARGLDDPKGWNLHISMGPDL